MTFPQLHAAFAAAVLLLAATPSQAATLALWDFNDPALGATNGAALPDSNSRMIWRIAAADKTGNGNHLTTWDFPWAGFAWSTNSPLGDFSIRSAGSYPAAFTWSASNAPTGVDLEKASLTRFTIEGVFTVGSGGNRTLVGRDGRYLSSGTPNNAALYFGIDGNDHPVLEFTDVNATRVRLVADTASVVEDGATWYHMAGTSDGTKVSLYLNHELVASTQVIVGPIATGSTSGSDWHAGGWSVARGLYGGAHTDRWLGAVDAIAISDAVLSTNSFILPKPAYTNMVPDLATVTNETVYLFCYHVGSWPNGGTSGVFVNWSMDGFNFYPLNGGHPVFVCPDLPGDDTDDPANEPNMTRDPSIRTNARLVQMWPNPADTVTQTWAPEWFYIEETGEYMIIFSSEVNTTSLRLYYTKTSDFTNFTTPVELYHDVAQSSVIDGYMAKAAPNHYIMATAQKGTIWIVDSTSPYGPWTERGAAAMANPREGPALFNLDGTWHLYADYFTGVSDNVFRMATSIDTTNWTDRSAETLLPSNSDVPDFDGPPHHGTVFRAPRATLGAYMSTPRGSITNLSSLAHRWSFTATQGQVPSGTILPDLISGATATVRGVNGEFTGTALRLPGTTTGNSAADSIAAYLDLPNGIISAKTNLTIEIWATAVSSKSWQRLFDFGRTVEAGDGLGAQGEWTGALGTSASGATSGSDNVFLSLNRGSDLNLQRCHMMLDGASNTTSDIAMDTVAGRQYFYAVTFEDGAGHYGSSGGRMTIYRNGTWIAYRDVAFHLWQIEDVNNWLGRSQWSGDSNSNVEYNEVRIYSKALTWPEIYGHFLAGPNVPLEQSPKLDIKVSGDTSTLTWPGNSAGFAPKRTGDFSTPGAWLAITNPIVSTTNGLQLTIPIDSSKQFFKLHR